MSTCPYRLYTWEPVLRRCTPATEVTGQKPVQYTAMVAATTAMVLLSHYTAAAVNTLNMALRRRQLTYTEIIRAAGLSPCDKTHHHKTSTRTRLSTRQRQKCQPVIRKVDLPLLEKMTQEIIHLD